MGPVRHPRHSWVSWYDFGVLGSLEKIEIKICVWEMGYFGRNMNPFLFSLYNNFVVVVVTLNVLFCDFIFFPLKRALEK